MADFSANTWKEQDAANTAPSPHGFPTGAAPSTLHPSIRNLVGASVRAWRRINGWYTTTGSATALILTPEQQVTAYVKERWGIVPNATNTGAMTLNVSSLGAKNILRLDGSALVAGDIAAGQFTELYYDGAAFRIINGAGAKFTGHVTAASFTGDGSALTNLNATELKSGTIHNDRINGDYTMNSIALNTRGYAPIWEAKTPAGTNSEFRLTIGSVRTGSFYQEATGAQNLVIRKFNPETGAGEGYFRIDGPGATDGKYNGATIWTQDNDGSGSGLDADLLDGYQAAGLYRNNASFSTTGNLTISNSSPTIDLIDTDSNTANTRIIQNSNNFHLQASNTTSAWNTKVQLEHDASTAYIKYNNIYFGEDNQVRIASDGNISGSKWGNTWISTYMDGRYAMAADSIVAGNGLSGGGNLTASRTITLGTPGNITNSTTNSVSTTSHTHALGFTAAEVYTGTNSNNTNFPIGTVLWAYRWGATYISRAQTTSLRLGNDGSWYGRAGSNAALSGTWAHRGDNNSGSDAWGIFQRIS